MEKEVRLDIAGVTYREAAIVSLHTHRQIFEGEPSIGNCFCGELNAELIIPSGDIPRNAKFVPYIRDAGGTWKKKSEFFVYTRQVDDLTEYVTIVAYDAIYRGEESFTQPGDQGEWPRKDIDVMREIAQRTGASICAESLAKINKGYEVQYPGIIMETTTKIDTGKVDEYGEPIYEERTETELKPDNEGALTMREVAGRIASFYGGNWIIDNNGEWRLIQLGDIPEETHFLIWEQGEPIRVGSDRIVIREGLEESHRMVIQNGDVLLIGGVRLIV